MKRCGIACLAALALLASQGVRAQAEPTPDTIVQAVQEALAGMGRKLDVKLVVREIGSCYPGTGEHKGQFVCVVQMNGPDATFREHKLQLAPRGAGWLMVPPAVSPHLLCPGKAEADSLFKARLGGSVRVTGVPREGDGSLTDTRGRQRDGKGPTRLMCVYELASGVGTSTAVAYFRYAEGKFALDGEIERWY